MRINSKELQLFSQLWKKETGKKLTRSKAVQEFHKLIALVKLHAEMVISQNDKNQLESGNKPISSSHNKADKTS